MTNRVHFDRWFKQQIDKLVEDRDAGFVLVMVTFPLLERYLRQKTGAPPKSPFYVSGLLNVLPELRTRQDAERFWRVYRHGLLHNVTMSETSHGLTHDLDIVEIQQDGKVWLNPVLFARRVLATIENDFEVFEKGHPIPTVTAYALSPSAYGPSTVYMGTAAPTPASKQKK